MYQLRSKALRNPGLQQSGYHWSLPVIPGHGGRAPGQKRDKFWTADPRALPGYPHPPAGRWPALPLPYLRTRARSWTRRKTRIPTAANERRRRQLEETNREIDQVVSDFYAALPREQARHIGAIYARYSSQFQDSVVDQIRALMEFAVEQRIFVPRDFIFFDLAERGALERRPGRTQLREALKARRFQVLLVFATNRLYRKSYKSVKLVEEEIVEKGMRCILVKQGIDTLNEKQWRLALQMYAAMDEAYTGMYAENIRAAHLGLAGKGLVYSTVPVGYWGKPVGVH